MHWPQLQGSRRKASRAYLRMRRTQNLWPSLFLCLCIPEGHIPRFDQSVRRAGLRRECRGIAAASSTQIPCRSQGHTFTSVTPYLPNTSFSLASLTSHLRPPTKALRASRSPLSDPAAGAARSDQKKRHKCCGISKMYLVVIALALPSGILISPWPRT